MSATPPLPCPRGADGVVANDRQWMHALRNEFNTAMMAAAAARHLLETGHSAEALENLRRTEAACRRGAQLLRRAPAHVD